uniref:Uncharacterized protein n=1 Tax=Salix viminalis TaxID=40686 RepID=A0A6N2ML15_SALVM
MPSSSFAGSFSTPKLNVAIDTGNPFLNVTVDGFLKIGTVAVTKSLAEEAYHIVKGGTVAGLYVGMEYGMERVRGTRDWKNAMLGGALTGALISAATNKDKDKIVIDAIAGGAIATASTFINCVI